MAVDVGQLEIVGDVGLIVWHERLFVGLVAFAIVALIGEPFVGCNPLGIAGKAVFESHALEAIEKTVDVANGGNYLFFILHSSLIEDCLVEIESDWWRCRHKVCRERNSLINPPLRLTRVGKEQGDVVVVENGVVGLFDGKRLSDGHSILHPHFHTVDKRLSIHIYLQSIGIAYCVNIYYSRGECLMCLARW